VDGDAPLTAEGRRRLVARVLDQGRPQAHVAAEAGVARATVRITAPPGPIRRWSHGSRRCAASASSRRG